MVLLITRMSHFGMNECLSLFPNALEPFTRNSSVAVFQAQCRMFQHLCLLTGKGCTLLAADLVM